jgi:hypothetical protein
VFVYEGVHQVTTHVWSILVQFEELAVIPRSQRFTDSESMVNTLIILLLLCELSQSSQSLYFHAYENLVKQFVPKKLNSWSLDFVPK